MDGLDGKHRLREALLAARRDRPADELATLRDAVCGHVLARVAGLACVAAYEPLRTEPGSVELLAGLRASGARVLVPITLPDRDLDWAEWAADGAGAQLGREAIAGAELVLAPALAVAVDGTRLGRGGGSYDRALARCGPSTATAALVFDDEVLPALPRDAWDRPVGAAVTPSGWRTLSGNADVPSGR